MLPTVFRQASSLLLGSSVLEFANAAALPLASDSTRSLTHVEVSAADVQRYENPLGRRAEPGNATDTQLQDTQSWYWAGINTTVTGMPSNPTVNLTGLAQPDEKYPNVNYFEDATKSISCADDCMNITFKDQDQFVEAQAGWSWINEGSHTVCLVVEPGTCNNTVRQPYRATYVTFDNSSQTASSFNGNIANLTAGDVTASIDCSDCSTRGTLNLDVDVSFSILDGLTGTASLTPSGVGANIELGLTVSGELTSELGADITLIDIPLPGGVDIAVIKLGPQLVVAANAGIDSITAATTISFGVGVAIPDDSLAKVDFGNSANNAFNGFTPTFSPIGPNLDASVSISGSVGPEIRLEIDATLLGKGASAGLRLAVPEFTLDVSAQASPEGGICGDDNAELGIEFDVNLGAELDAFGGLGAASDLPNQFALISTATPIFSTCVTVAGSATSAVGPLTQTAQGVGAFGGVVSSIPAASAARNL